MRLVGNKTEFDAKSNVMPKAKLFGEEMTIVDGRREEKQSNEREEHPVEEARKQERKDETGSQEWW